jgi:23S rRNA (cytosine1962-C5)-methyltransferase
VLPCQIFEDEHLLVVNKPAGLNTHGPSPYAGEGLYDWLRHREPRWADLAIIHRLDKETSGVMVFSKSALANRSLTDQFTRRVIRKKYVLLTDRQPRARVVTAKSNLIRTGAKYTSTSSQRGEPAETRFEVKDIDRTEAATLPLPSLRLVEAVPLTGRTHQIRVHAAENGFPILGDVLYGGTSAARVYLHASEITFRHPASGKEMSFVAPPDFRADPRTRLRSALIDIESTDAYRVIHGASDSWPEWYVDRLGQFLLSQSDQPLNEEQRHELARLADLWSVRGAYHKILSRQVRGTSTAEASPQRGLGEAAPERFLARENGVQFELSFSEGYSVGLFLDQRENRRRLLTGHVAADFSLTFGAQPTLLNAFSYTCGFSVCAAKAGFHTTSLDLSRKYLDWGRSNFVRNHLDPAAHDFIYGDAFDWFQRLRKKARTFDCVLLDPPTFSQSKQSGVFRTERDYGKLVGAALPLLKLGGVLFASTNTASWPPEAFIQAVESAARTGKRKILKSHYLPQPPDFPISRSEPGYLKTFWARLD